MTCALCGNSVYAKGLCSHHYRVSRSAVKHAEGRSCACGKPLKGKLLCATCTTRARVERLAETMPPCACGRPFYAKGLCSPCYAQHRRTTRAASRPPCGCGKPAVQANKCDSCYYTTWYAENLERGRARSARRQNKRRSNLVGSGGSYTSEEWAKKLQEFGYRCPCCGRNDVKLTVDHIVPVSAGGSSNVSNLQPLCVSCNSRKRDRIVRFQPIIEDEPSGVYAERSGEGTSSSGNG